MSQTGGMLRDLVRMIEDHRLGRVTDRELLEQYIRENDESAFAGLVHRHGPMVWGVCLRLLGNSADAEDAFQATFLVLVRKANSVVKRQSIGNWLYGVAFRTARRATGRRAHSRTVQVNELVADVTDDPGNAAHWNEIKGLLDQELNKLPEKYRAPIVLCHLEGRTVDQAAVQLQWPRGTVAGRLSRGRKLLHRRLLGRGVTVSVGILGTVMTHQATAAVAPAQLVGTTVKTAITIGAGTAALGGAVSLSISTLTEGVIKTMFYSNLKIAAVSVLALGTIGTGAGVVTYQAVGAMGGDGVLVAQEGKPGQEEEKADREAVREPENPKSPTKKIKTRTQVIYDKLEQPVPELNEGIIPGTPLSEALHDIIGKATGIIFRIDEDAFRQEGVQDVRSSPVGVPPSPGMPLRTFLRDMLLKIDPEPGAFTIQNGHIVVTTHRRALTTQESVERWTIELGPFTFSNTIHVNYDDTSLRDVINDLGERYGLNILLDSRADPEELPRISAALQNAPPFTAISLFAEMAGLDAVLVDNIIFITTKESAVKLREKLPKITLPKGKEDLGV